MLKELAKNLARKMGYEIVGPPRAHAAQRTLMGLIHQERVNLVLDIGANTGQFVEELRAAGYAGRIISFEPLASAHATLLKLADRDPNWNIAGRTAIGAVKGSVEIHISGNSVSSSILEMLPSHTSADPQSTYVGTELVPVNRLDDLVTPGPADRVLLKIDVQGYERQVLDGAAKILGSCHAVISEMSLIPLYEGQVLAREMWDMLAAHGFQPWSLEPCYRNPQTGQMLQFDGVFVRSKDQARSSSPGQNAPQPAAGVS